MFNPTPLRLLRCARVPRRCFPAIGLPCRFVHPQVQAARQEDPPRLNVAFAAGAAVVVTGLQRNVDQNGRRGVVREPEVPGKPGRVGVEVNGKVPPEGTRRAVDFP